jgi:hypothetical protein
MRALKPVEIERVLRENVKPHAAAFYNGSASLPSELFACCLSVTVGFAVCGGNAPRIFKFPQYLIDCNKLHVIPALT